MDIGRQVFWGQAFKESWKVNRPLVLLLEKANSPIFVQMGFLVSSVNNKVICNLYLPGQMIPEMVKLY